MRCGFGPSIHSSRSLTCTVAFSFVSTSSFAVTTFVGVLDTRAVSNSAAFKSFFLSMCIDDPDSTTNSLSSEAPRRAKGKCSKGDSLPPRREQARKHPRQLQNCRREKLEKALRRAGLPQELPLAEGSRSRASQDYVKRTCTIPSCDSRVPELQITSRLQLRRKVLPSYTEKQTISRTRNQKRMENQEQAQQPS